MAKSKNCGVYAIINKVNCKLYIGSSKTLQERKCNHFSALRRNNHSNEYLQKSFNKNGIDNFEFKILKLCKEEDLLKEEQFFINKYNSTNKNCGYNISLTAGRISMTEEIKKKIGDANKGKKYKWRQKMSKETRKKISIAKKGNNNRQGCKHSEATKQKMSDSQKGKKNALGCIRTDKQKEHLRKINTGKKHSIETREKLSKINMKYQHFTNEWKELYKNGKSFCGIGKIYKIDHHTIKRYVKREVNVED